jgi:hypothetical protein
MTFGINGRDLFHSSDHDYIPRHRKNEERQEQLKSEEEARSGIIIHPNPQDVLVGRGRPYLDHIGNRRLANYWVGERYLERYRAANRFQKTCILLETITSLHDEEGGRFVQKCGNGGWVVVSEKMAREKVAKVFRFLMGKAGDGSDDGATKPSSQGPRVGGEGGDSPETRTAKRLKTDSATL